MRLSVYELRQHDDIRRLAARLLGDQARWRELVRINRLEYPYLSNHPEDYPGLRVLGPGDELLYPGEPIAEVTATQQADAEAEAFGRDLRLSDGYLVLQGANLAMISGLPNVRDAIDRRINTPLGGLPAHLSSYGHTAKQYLGLMGSEEVLELVNLDLERAIAADSRVQSVSTSSVHRPGTLRASSRVQLIQPGGVFRTEQELAAS